VLKECLKEKRQKPMRKKENEDDHKNKFNVKHHRYAHLSDELYSIDRQEKERD
jgi:hypothetical protein